MKELAIIANIVGSAYFMSDMLIQHDKANELLAGLDNGFKELLLKLKEKQPTETIIFLLKLFSILTGAAFVGILLMGVLKVHSQQIAFILSVIFLIAGIFSGSLFWVLKHKEVLKHVGQCEVKWYPIFVHVRTHFMFAFTAIFSCCLIQLIDLIRSLVVQSLMKSLPVIILKPTTQSLP